MKTYLCVHDDVCRYKVGEKGERCGSEEFCRFYDEGEEDRPTRKYNKKSAKIDPDDDIGEATISKKEFRKAIIILKYRLKAGKLDDNQKLAFEGIKGKHFKSISEEQKAQMVEMAK